MNSSGVQGNGWSSAPSISGDGQFVAFHSDASNLVPDDTNGVLDVFVAAPAEFLTDFSISDVKLIQVVEDPDINSDGRIDLVLLKPMVVRVQLNVANAPEQDVEIRLSFEGGEFTETRTVAELIAGPVDFFITPGDLGDSTILITVDPSNQISESDETNNHGSSLVTVKETILFQLPYF